MMKRLAILLGLALGSFGAAYAAQNFLSIDPSVPSGDTGTTMANKLNDWKTSILTSLSGTSRPSVAVAGTVWLDTTSSTWAVKMYNGTSDATLFTVDSTNLRPIFSGAVPWVDGAGSADSITATYSPVVGALTDGMLVGVRATAANATTTPTLQVNGTAAATIVKNNNAALLVGDITGDNHEMLLRWASGIGKWVLLNPGAVSVPDNSVTSAKIVDGAVTSADISDGTVSSTDITNSTIVAGDVASNTLLGSNIFDGTIDLADLAAAVTAKMQPVGTIIAFGGGSCPSLYLEANGSAVNRTTYSALFSALSTRWGDGDGSTTFEIPDLRGQFLRGWDHGAGVDPDRSSRFAWLGGGATGDNVGSYQDDDYASHNHSFSDGVNWGCCDNDAQASAGTARNTSPSNETVSGTTGGSGGNETRPENAYVLYCVFAGV